MIHTMPDKTVRVTSRCPKGHGTVCFDLTKAQGFTLEEDRYHPETFVLKAVGCCNDYAACYGDPAEAEADLADLALLLADRHTLPAAPSVPALSSTQPSIVLGHARRRVWGWKGTHLLPARAAREHKVAEVRVPVRAASAERRRPQVRVAHPRRQRLAQRRQVAQAQRCVAQQPGR